MRRHKSLRRRTKVRASAGPKCRIQNKDDTLHEQKLVFESTICSGVQAAVLKRSGCPAQTKLLWFNAPVQIMRSAPPSGMASDSLLFCIGRMSMGRIYHREAQACANVLSSSLSIFAGHCWSFSAAKQDKIAATQSRLPDPIASDIQLRFRSLPKHLRAGKEFADVAAVCMLQKLLSEFVVAEIRLRISTPTFKKLTKCQQSRPTKSPSKIRNAQSRKFCSDGAEGIRERLHLVANLHLHLQTFLVWVLYKMQL